MSNKKISQFNQLPDLMNDTDEVPIVRAGKNYKANKSGIKAARADHATNATNAENAINANNANLAALARALQSATFTSGMLGNGMRIYVDEDGKAKAELDELMVRGKLAVNELSILKMRSLGGTFVVSSYARLMTVSGNNGEYVANIDTDDGTISVPFEVDDIIACRVMNSLAQKYYIARVTEVDTESFKFEIIDGSGAPASGDEVVQIDNYTNTNRQGILYLTNADVQSPYLDVREGMITSNNVLRVRIGRLDGIVDSELGTLSGWGAYLDNVYARGVLLAMPGSNVALVDDVSALEQQLNKVIDDDVATAYEKRTIIKPNYDILKRKVDEAIEAAEDLELDTTALEVAFYGALKPYVDALTLNGKINTDSPGDGAPFSGATLRNLFLSAESELADINKAIITRQQEIAEDALDTANNIKIGGTNLLDNSEALFLSPASPGNGTAVLMNDEPIPYRRVTPNINMYASVVGASIAYSAGKTYIASVDVRHSHSSNVNVRLRFLADVNSMQETSVPPGVWVRITSKAHVFASDTSSSLALNTQGAPGVALDYRRIQIEEGNVATSWRLSENDILNKTSKIISLSASTQIIQIDKNGNRTPANPFTVTGVAQNTNITSWQYSVDGGLYSTVLPTGVTRADNVVTIDPGAVTFKTLAIRASDGTYSDTLTIARAIDGQDGKDGEDGKGIAIKGTVATYSALPTTGLSAGDAYLVSSDGLLYIYDGTQFPAEGHGVEFKGDKGDAGEDGYTVILTNEVHTFAGSETAAIAGSTSCDVLVYKGGTMVPASITVGTLPTGMTASVSGNTITFNATPSLTTASGTVDISIVADGKTFPKKFSYSISFKGQQGEQGLQGVPGEPGADGQTLYTWIKYADTPTSGMSDSGTGKEYIGLAYNKTTPIESNDYSDYTWVKIKGEQGVQGAPGADGQTLYTWIKYADVADGTGMYDTPNANTLYIGIAVNKTTPTESTNKADYTWSRFRGADGQTLYTWIKYADTPTSGMSDDGTGKAYIGIATNRTTPVESTNYEDYVWTKIKGEDGDQGIPGPPGEDGQTLYTWIKYADTPTSGMSDSPAGKEYIGIAVNKTTPVESTNYGDYTWSKIKGEQGVPGPAGADAPLLYLSASANTMVFNADNTPNPTSQTITFEAKLQNISGVATFTATPYNGTTALSPITLGGSGNTRTLTQAQWGTNFDKVVVEATLSGLSDKVTIFRLKNGAAGAKGEDGYTVILENEAHIFAGNTNSAIAGSTTVKVISYKGATAITPTSITVGTMPTGMTASVSGNVITFNVTSAMTSPSGTVPINIVIDGKTFTRPFSYAISFKGADGVSIVTVDVEFAKNTNPSTPPTSGWTTTAPTLGNGEQLWTRTKTAYSSGSPTYSTPVNITPREGAAGKGITSIVEEYYLSTSKTTQTGGSWVTTPPTWEFGKYMWTRVKITYSDGTTSYTTPIVSSEWEVINDLKVGGENLLNNSEAPLLSPSSTGTGTTVLMTDEPIPYRRVTPNTGVSVSVLGVNMAYSAGKTYIASVDVRHSHSSNINVRLRFLADVNSMQETSVPPNVWVRITSKAHLFSSNTTTSLVLNIFETPGVVLDYRRIQIEEGNVSTNWKPSLADTEVKIAAAQAAADNALSIANSKVTTYTSPPLSYKAGDFMRLFSNYTSGNRTFYAGKIYVANTDSTGGFTPAHWDDTMEVGGVNLVLDSDNPIGATTSGLLGKYLLVKALETGKKYTITIKGSGNSLQLRDDNGANTLATVLNIGNGLYRGIFTYNGAWSGNTKTIAIYNIAGGSAAITWIKLEEGIAVSSDWSPAPQEMDYLKDALKKTTLVTGGLTLGSIIAVRDGNGVVRAYFNGEENSPIALAVGVGNFAGIGGVETQKIALLRTGAGWLANGNIYWDADGDLTVKGRIEAEEGYFKNGNLENVAIANADIEEVSIDNAAIDNAEIVSANISNSVIGGFQLDERSLINTNFEASIEFFHLLGNYTNFESIIINDDSNDRLISLQTLKSSKTALHINTDAVGAKGIEVQANGASNRAIESKGGHSFFADAGEYWNAPGILACITVNISGNSASININNTWKISPLTLSVGSWNSSTQVLRINHNLGHQNYAVVVNLNNIGGWTKSLTKATNYFEFDIDNGNNNNTFMTILIIGHNRA